MKAQGWNIQVGPGETRRVKMRISDDDGQSVDLTRVPRYRIESLVQKIELETRNSVVEPVINTPDNEPRILGWEIVDTEVGSVIIDVGPRSQMPTLEIMAESRQGDRK